MSINFLGKSQNRKEENQRLSINQKSDRSDYLFKILIIGDSGVGKSSILSRFADQHYSSEYISTIGVDFRIQTLEIDGKIIKLQIWDTAGQQRFRTITNSYYRGAHGALVVYDVTDRQSFNHLPNWLKEIDKSGQQSIPILIIGTKTDLTNKRVISKEEGQQFAQHYQLKLIETSAKDNQNIEECFRQLAQQIKDRYDSTIKTGNDKSQSNLLTGQPLLSSKKSCCLN